jgi:hypothetical protein
MGIIQWNIRSKSAFPILKRMHEKDPAAFQECYEGGSPERFKPYFATGWPASHPKDAWKHSEFVTFLSSSNLHHHYLWIRLLHAPEAITPCSDNPGWRTKPDFSAAAQALRPEIIDFFKRLALVPAFQQIQLESAWKKYGHFAISEIKWLREACKEKYPDIMKGIELRTLAAFYDLCVQQGNLTGAPPTPDSHPLIKAKLAANDYGTQKDIVTMAVLERAKTASAAYRNDCASRRLGILNAALTPYAGLGPTSATRFNVHFDLLKDNPHVHDL